MAKSKNISISEQLRRIISDRGFTPTEVAERSGVDRSVISRFLRDDGDEQRRGLTLASADKIAAAFHLRLIEDAPPKTKPKTRSKASMDASMDQS